MRAKTGRPTNIPVKRTSEGVETSSVISETTFVAPPVNLNSDNNSTAISSVFPVKIVLKKSSNDVRIQQVDKENIDPFTGAPIEWDDLDAEDAGDPLMVSDYVVDIFDYMKQLEVKQIR